MSFQSDIDLGQQINTLNMKAAKNSSSANMNMVHTIGASPVKQQKQKYMAANHRSQDELEHGREDDENYCMVKRPATRSQTDSRWIKQSAAEGKEVGRGDQVNRSTVINSKTGLNSTEGMKMAVSNELRAKSPDVNYIKHVESVNDPRRDALTHHKQSNSVN
jgi:hypothetical protein